MVEGKFTPDEAFRQIDEALQARAEKFANQQPSQEAYENSSLLGWLELNYWTAEEGICLLFDIEPSTAEIHWAGYFDDEWKRTKLLRIENAQFLRERDTFLDTPRLTEVYKSGTSSYRSHLDDDTFGYKEYLIRSAEPQMHRAWQLYERNGGMEDDLRNLESPVDRSTGRRISRNF